MVCRILFLIVIMILAPLSAFAGASNNNKESKQEIKQIEHAQAVDQQMGVNEGQVAQPVKKSKSPATYQSAFQPRSGFQQQPAVTSGDQRR